MPPVAQSISCSLRPSRLAPWNLLARLSDLLRRRLPNLDPEQLSPHLRCDLGLSESELRGSGLPSSAPRDFWPR